MAARLPIDEKSRRSRLFVVADIRLGGKGKFAPGRRACQRRVAGAAAVARRPYCPEVEHSGSVPHRSEQCFVSMSDGLSGYLFERILDVDLQEEKPSRFLIMSE